MELSTIAQELYGLPLKEFTAARDARAAEARKAGDRELAESVKRLRKPSTGAWMTNLLVREQKEEIKRLIERGETLRSARDLDGARIRQATKDKSEMVTKLLRRTRAIAKGVGTPLSKSIEQEIEGTLDAAFSDPDSAKSLREGCLTTTLHYSGLGFGAGADTLALPARSGEAGRDEPSVHTAKAEENLEQAQTEAARASSEVERAQRAVKAAEADLDRLRAALAVAARRGTRANEKASNAQKKLDRLRRTRPGRT